MGGSCEEKKETKSTCHLFGELTNANVCKLKGEA